MKKTPEELEQEWDKMMKPFEKSDSKHCSSCLDSSSMAGQVVRELGDHSLHGRRFGTSDADKLKMIKEVLRRKKEYSTSPKIVKRWLSERGLF